MYNGKGPRAARPPIFSRGGAAKLFVLERCYDFEELARHNVHTHSVFSNCAKPEMLPEAMVLEAARCGLKTLAITDHSDPGDAIDTPAVFAEVKRRVSRMETPVRVLVGAELSAFGVGRYAEPYAVDRALDLASYSHVHYHLKSWEQPEDRSPGGYAAHMLAVLRALFETGRADHIAHPFSPNKMHFFDEAQKNAVLAAISDAALGEILQAGERADCSFELHTPSCFRFPAFYRRMFLLGREVGAHFIVGTDAHTLAAISTAGIAERLRGIMG